MSNNPSVAGTPAAKFLFDAKSIRRANEVQNFLTGEQGIDIRWVENKIRRGHRVVTYYSIYVINESERDLAYDLVKTAVKRNGSFRFVFPL